MKEEYLEPWCAALESGEYLQTHGVLCDGKGHCCLGVFVETIGSKFEQCQEGSDAGEYLPTPINGIELHAGAILLSDAALEMCGLTETQMTRLAKLNDGEKNRRDPANPHGPKLPDIAPLSFTQIAKVIREEMADEV